MAVEGGWLDASVLSAADARWYADLAAQCTPLKSSLEQPLAVLAEINLLPWTKCLHMVGDASEDGAYIDSKQQRWSDDRKGRWSGKISKNKAYLHHRVVQLQQHEQPNRPRLASDVVSHLCGNCDCVRWEHIRYQSKREDTLDNAHHKRVKRFAKSGVSLSRFRHERCELM